MSGQTEFENEIASLLIEALELEDVAAADIEPEAPLFGHESGSLGLDSIDALEIALAIKQRFDVELRPDDEENSKIFASLRTLASHVQHAQVTT